MGGLHKTKLLIASLLILAVAGVFFTAAWFVFPPFQKSLLTAYLHLPSLKSIDEKNINPEYTKTVIALPQETGFLVAVYKDRHELELYQDNVLVKTYRVNIRREQEDAEVAEDDQTPEGIFAIETMDVVSNPPWERWMRLNTLDKAKGMYAAAYTDGADRIGQYEKEHGSITTDADIRAFNGANSDQELLRGIGIHGGGFSLNRDWTKGCVGMADADVIELFNFLKTAPSGGIGTKVVIQD